MFKIILISLVALSLSYTQVINRIIDKKAIYGTVEETQFNRIKIGEKVFVISPGAKIYNGQQMLVLPNNLTAQSKIAYVLDGQGYVKNIWILNPNEFKIQD